jgi:hypothetical protein
MDQENISFFINDNVEQTDNYEKEMDINEILNTEYISEYIFKEEEEESLYYTKFLHYDINYKVNQLLRICEYYGIKYYGTSKDIRINKCNKSDVLNTLIIYENKIENQERVNKRKKLWHYINELKNDKFMKKYVLWN